MVVSVRRAQGFVRRASPGIDQQQMGAKIQACTSKEIIEIV